MKPETKEKVEKVVSNVDSAIKLTEEKVGKPAVNAVKGFEVPIAVAIILMLLVGLSMKMLIIGGIAMAAMTSPKWVPGLLAKISKPAEKKEEVVAEQKQEVAEAVKEEK